MLVCLLTRRVKQYIFSSDENKRNNGGDYNDPRCYCEKRFCDNLAVIDATVTRWLIIAIIKM